MKFSMADLSLKRRVCVAVALVSVIPLILIFYYFSGYDEITLTATIMASLIVVLGWWVIFEVFASIINVYRRS